MRKSGGIQLSCVRASELKTFCWPADRNLESEFDILGITETHVSSENDTLTRFSGHRSITNRQLAIPFPTQDWVLPQKFYKGFLMNQYPSKIFGS